MLCKIQSNMFVMQNFLSYRCLFLLFMPFLELLFVVFWLVFAKHSFASV